MALSQAEKQEYVSRYLAELRKQAISDQQVYDAQALNIGRDLGRGAKIELIDHLAFAKIALRSELSQKTLGETERFLSNLGFDVEEK